MELHRQGSVSTGLPCLVFVDHLIFLRVLVLYFPNFYPGLSPGLSPGILCLFRPPVLFLLQLFVVANRVLALVRAAVAALCIIIIHSCHDEQEGQSSRQGSTKFGLMGLKLQKKTELSRTNWDKNQVYIS